ncbi:hypothetical protein ABMB68_008638 [Bradyrhizobium sp. RT4a]
MDYPSSYQPWPKRKQVDHDRRAPSKDQLLDAVTAGTVIAATTANS